MKPAHAMIVAGLCLTLVAPPPALAWNDQGHMASGAIAYDTLKAEHPQAVAAIVAIMRDHPDRALFDQQLDGLSGAARERRMFAIMARWPDDARRGPFDRPDWHYSLRLVTPWGWVLPITVGKAERAFRDNLALARNPAAPRAQRAVALCWVLHIVGDMHQPLHGGHWLSLQYPKSDRSGSLAWVRPYPGAAPNTLHDVWDGIVDRPGSRVQGSEALARDVEAVHPHRMTPRDDREPMTAYRSWVAQSRVMARAFAYDGGHLVSATTPEAAPVLTKAYVVRARSLSEGRIAAAGYRLSDLLATVR